MADNTSKKLNSAKIKVYPSGYRAHSIDLEASRTTEGSVTKAIKASLHTYNFAKIESDNSLTIVLKGYVINVDSKTSITDLFQGESVTNIYAILNTALISTTEDSQELTMMVSDDSTSQSTLDKDNKFSGVVFQSTEPNSTSDYLLILTKDEKGEWDIPATSKLNLTTEQIRNTHNGTKSIAEEFTVSNITNSSLDNTNKIYVAPPSGEETKTNLALVTDSSNKLITKDLSKSAEDATADSGNTFTYVTDYKQNSDGEITVLSRKTTTIDSGNQNSGQGTFIVNGSYRYVNNLTTGGKPTFKSVTSDQAIVSDTITIGYESEIDSEGQIVKEATGLLKVIGKGKIKASENIESEKSLTVQGQSTTNELVVNNTTKLKKTLEVSDNATFAKNITANDGYVGRLTINNKTISSILDEEQTVDIILNKSKQTQTKSIDDLLNEFKFDGSNIFTCDLNESGTINVIPYYYDYSTSVSKTWWNLKAPLSSDSSEGKLTLIAQEKIKSFSLTIKKGFNINSKTGKVATNYCSGNIAISAFDSFGNEIGQTQTATFNRIEQNTSIEDLPDSVTITLSSDSTYIHKIEIEYKENNNGKDVYGGYNLYTSSIVVVSSSDITLLAKNIKLDGNVTVSGEVEASSFNATSDRRLKENIKEYTCNKSILNLPVYKYDFINGEKNQIGCIAQELQEICPEIVKENEKGYLSIQESKIVYLLLEEIKKLKLRVDELEGK